MGENSSWQKTFGIPDGSDDERARERNEDWTAYFGLPQSVESDHDRVEARGTDWSHIDVPSIDD